MIKHLFVLISLMSTAAFANDDCRSLPSVEKRNECHVKNAMSDLPAAPRITASAKPVLAPAPPDHVDELANENDRVKGKLNKICRGC
jgi:hypothetical protein